jgi:hypothetical protein
MVSMRISGVAGTNLFIGTPSRPFQLVRVRLAGDQPGTVADPGAQVTVRVDGPGLRTASAARVAAPDPGAELSADVGVEIAAPATPGSTRQALATVTGPAGRAELPAEITVAEPGWTMWMVSHFHYDPVWWGTQGQFLETRLVTPDEDGTLPAVRSAFELVRLHLDAARTDPDYKFVLAEIDYLKPHLDTHPEDRADLLDLIAAGRVELVGGCYNEPNTNLTSAESTIRNAVFGLGYQRGMLGGDPRTAWMLDAFGHDPGFPGLMAAAGLTESSWARGPFHQWGPNRTVGDNTRMQFASEFEWLSPDGSGLLTAYMPNHYGAGWVTHQAASLADAEDAARRQFAELSPVAATRNVLLPVGADHVIPSRWITELHRDWNARYAWPRFVTAVPSEFFAAVRKEAAERDIWITPQTRDMNPLYTGKDVSYIDTKQAQRAAETAIADGEKLATLAWLAGARYPAASLDRAWRLLAFGAHHDAITGTEGDQVYLDLLAGWREAYERGDAARRDAAGFLAGLANTALAVGPDGDAAASGASALVVVNTLSFPRSGMVTAELEPRFPAPAGGQGGSSPRASTAWLELRDDTGAVVPFLAEGASWQPDGTLATLTVTFRAADVPPLGYRTYLVLPAAQAAGAAAGGDAGWRAMPGTSIENGTFRATADPARGGTLARLLDRRSGTELLAGPGNELVLQPEYPRHPRWGEGPWLLSPAGPGTGSSAGPATVRAERCPVGSRLVAEFDLGGLRVTQETVLWDDAEVVQFRTHVDGSIGQDRLLRARFPASVRGGLPVFQTALSVLGRTPGRADVDVAEHEFTLDNPAHEWFGVGATARVRVTAAGRADASGETAGPPGLQAIGVAEVIAPDAPGESVRLAIRDLLVALARQGVTATLSRAGGPRYGSIDLDSNLPDFRIALGGPDTCPVTAGLAGSPGADADWLRSRLADPAPARLWLPAHRSRADAFAPGADLRGSRDLPVLVVTGPDLAAAVRDLIGDLRDGVVEADGPPAVRAGQPGAHPDGAGGPATALDGYTVALLNRGIPGSLVSPDGTMMISLMRACSSWPCAVWIDGERRTTPDGTSFALQHWSHTFEYALAAGRGDWRAAGFPLAGLDYNHPFLAVPAPAHDGPLPASASLASAEPGTALVSAIKPAGNPLAPAGQPDPRDGVTIRLRDLSGRSRPGAARVRLFTGVSAARRSALCEDSLGEPVPCSDGAAVAEVPAAGLVTLAAIPGRPSWVRDQPADASQSADPAGAGPDYARYWLHGTGPAPAGNVPVAVHLSPTRLDLGGSQRASARLTVACGPEPAAGQVCISAPAGITVQPAGPLSFDLPGLGHTSWELTVGAAPGLPAGSRFLTAQVSDAAGRLTEDAALITGPGSTSPGGTGPGSADPGSTSPGSTSPGSTSPGGAEPGSADLDPVAADVQLTLGSRELALRPGEAGAIAADLRNGCASAISGTAQLISPTGSWQQVPTWSAEFTAGPGETVSLTFPVAVPATARPGQRWWAIIKVMSYGRLWYSESALVKVS